MASEMALKMSAFAWCKESTKNKEMDVVLAEVFAEIIDEVTREPWLGNATNAQLLEELSVRLEVDGMLDYRTVDGEEHSKRKNSL